jgi:4-hydroxybenzoate polyprenyltransferase
LSAVAWGRLLRLSLAPSAAADALAGMTLGAWGAFPLDPRAALLPIASLCVFHGGMALNDWADRAADARTRPDRPIPSGAVPADRARFAAVALLALGPALAHAAAPLAGVCLAGVALSAVLYDLAGRGPWLGPVLLGLCRGGNLASGVFAGAALSTLDLSFLEVARSPHWAWLACALYALYVFCASRLARLEDDEDSRELGSRPTLALLSAAACLALLPWTVLLGLDAPLAVTVGEPGAWTVLMLFLAPGILLGLVSAGLLAAEARAGSGSWTRARVGRAAGMSLRRLLVFSSICAWCATIVAMLSGAGVHSGTERGLILAPLLLLGYPIALRLRRVFPPT